MFDLLNALHIISYTQRKGGFYVYRYPVSHGSSYVFASHQLLALPLECEVVFENSALPVRHVSELVHERQHRPFSDCVAELPIIKCEYSRTLEVFGPL